MHKMTIDAGKSGSNLGAVLLLAVDTGEVGLVDMTVTTRLEVGSRDVRECNPILYT